jgi:hypothetical protein
MVRIYGREYDECERHPWNDEGKQDALRVERGYEGLDDVSEKRPFAR